MKTSAFCSSDGALCAGMLPKREVRQSQAGFMRRSAIAPDEVLRNGAAAQAFDMMDNARASPTCHNPNNSSRQTYLQRDISRPERSGFQLRKQSHDPPDSVHFKETRSTWEQSP